METITPPTPRSIGAIAQALAKAQGEIVQPQKNKTVEVRDKNNPQKTLYTFDYADYGAIVEAIKGPLSKHGLCFTHLVEINGNSLLLVTRLIHSSGEYLETVYPLPNTLNPKDFGGALTYGKRYSLSALTGCVADDDDDGSAVNKPNEKTTEFKDKEKPLTPKVNGNPEQKTEAKKPILSEAQIKRLFAIASASNWTHEMVKAEMLKSFGISSTSELTRLQYESLILKIQGPKDEDFDFNGGAQ